MKVERLEKVIALGANERTHFDKLEGEAQDTFLGRRNRIHESLHPRDRVVEQAQVVGHDKDRRVGPSHKI